MTHMQQYQLQKLADLQARQKNDSTRHKCFISYHAVDTDEVAQFLTDFGTEFIAKTIGITDEDDFIDSVDTGYVMDQVRTKYLGDSSVTIVLAGRCTWARRYVDWEIFSSLRNSKYSNVNGLIAVTLPSVASYPDRSVPPRLADNVIADSVGNQIGYARWWKYPTTKTQLRGYISDAYDARTSRALKIINTRPRRRNSSPCS